MTIGEWVITSTHSPITLPTGVKDILLSLWPSLLRSFRHKPGFVELLQRLPRVQRLLRTPSKRAATESLVSPRTHKRVQHNPPSTTCGSAPAIVTSIPEDDENSLPPPSPTPHRSNPIPLPLPPTIHTPVGRPEKTKKKPKFPSQFPARYVLSKVSQYLIERKHGGFLKTLKRICTPHSVEKTTAATFPKVYMQNRPHFVTLDRDTQLSITWSELGLHAKEANTPVDEEFIPFTDPGPSPILPCPTTPGTRLTLFVIPVVPLLTASNVISNPTIPVTPAAPDVVIPPPPSTAQQIIRTLALFPLDANILQPLLPEQRALLDAEYNLIRAISKDFHHADTTWVEGPTGQGVSFRLCCPFCDAELPGTEYSPVLKNLLNSQYIQENTEPDPTLQNPNARRSLRGHQVYSDFCSQHRLEELLPDAKAAGWPYPPEFANLQHRVRSKETFINELTVGIQTGLAPSRFYLEALVMSESQRREQAQDVVAAG